jgi:cysteine synthase A
MHERTTGPEILAAFADTHLDYFIAGCGTGGTIAGVARVLRRESPATQIVACEPDNAPVLASGIAQPRDAAGAPLGSHPSFRPHPMQGWSPDFVSSITESALGEGLVDRVVPVSGHEAMRLARELARQEGIFTGITGGATVAGALSIAASAPPGSNILCLLPDTGERYQSTPLFADIPVDMTEEELEISRSTPGGRFDMPAPALPAAAAVSAHADPEAEAFVDRTLADRCAPVLMFALEWCEFCWAVRRLVAQLGVPLKSVDLDSTAYQTGGLGGRIRAVLTARTGITTIPQVFVGGELIGGCTEVIDAVRRGELQSRLARLGLPVADRPEMDPRNFLPGWLQPRAARAGTAA